MEEGNFTLDNRYGLMYNKTNPRLTLIYKEINNEPFYLCAFN